MELKSNWGKAKTIGVLVVIALIVMLIYGSAGTGVSVRTAKVIKGKISAYTEERGRTSLPHLYHVTMPMEGRVLPILVEQGDMVRKGEIVVRLDNAEWIDATKETADIISAVGKWVEAIGAQVRAGNIRLDFTEWEWKANEKLLKAQTISDREERESRRRYLDSSVKIEESQAMLQMSKSIQSIMDLLPGYVSRNLERTEVRSPVAGTILKRHVWNEKVMTPGEPLLDIGNLSELEITADILTEEAVRIQVGDKVEIFGEAVGDQKLAGVVRMLEPEAFTKISSMGVEEQRVTVKISFAEGALKTLQDTGRSLGLHYRVRVKIITDEKDKALLVPRTALFHGMKGQWQLYKVDGGRAKLMDVEVGLLNDMQAELLSGIVATDEVIIAPESTVIDGVKVAVAM